MHILIIGKVWPEPKSSAAGTRMMQLIKLFQKQNWQITFASPAQESDYSVNLSELDIETVSIKVNDDSFDTFVKKLQPKVVLYDRFMMEEQFGWRVTNNCPFALTILNTEDIHGLREARRLAVHENRAIEPEDYQNDVALREIAALLRSDVSLIISAFEMQFLQNHWGIPSTRLLYLPLLVEIEKRENKSFEERKDFYTIGNFYHQPNWDAVHHLKHAIWPLIRKQLPKANLHIYGAYPPQKAVQMNNEKQGFIVHGRVEDAREVAGSSRVCLAPLRYGAGLKGKLIEAMLAGTPSVTSSIGAEGMHGSLPWSGSIADDPEEFAREAINLYKDAELWLSSQAVGKRILKNCFDETLFQDSFHATLLAIINQLSTNRKQHPMSAVLNHHTLKSSAYLSKWITAKNKV